MTNSIRYKSVFSSLREGVCKSPFDVAIFYFFSLFSRFIFSKKAAQRSGKDQFSLQEREISFCNLDFVIDYFISNITKWFTGHFWDPGPLGQNRTVPLKVDNLSSQQSFWKWTVLIESERWPSILDFIQPSVWLTWMMLKLDSYSA